MDPDQLRQQAKMMKGMSPSQLRSMNPQFAAMSDAQIQQAVGYSVDVLYPLLATYCSQLALPPLRSTTGVLPPYAAAAAAAAAAVVTRSLVGLSPHRR
jgi:hypothetical protein